MTTKSMGSGQIARFIRICEDQGIGVTRTKKGLFLRFPDGTSTVQHFTVSDSKAINNQIARFRRAGVTHPDDPRGPKDLPKYITEGTVTNATKQRIIDYIVAKGYPEAVIQADITREIGMDAGVVNRALYHSGFKPGKRVRKIGRNWYTPAHILELQESGPVPVAKSSADLVRNVAERARQAQQAVNELGAGKPEAYKNPGRTIGETATPDFIEEHRSEPSPAIVSDPPLTEAESEAYWDAISDPPESTPIPVNDPVIDEVEAGITEPERALPQEPVTTTVPKAVTDNIKPVSLQKDGEREFIDSHESWVVDPSELFGSSFERFLSDQLRVIRALGLEFEIRVWRKS